MAYVPPFTLNGLRKSDVTVIEITLTDLCRAEGGVVLERHEVPAPPPGAVQHGSVIDAEIDGVAMRWRYDDAQRLVRYVRYGAPSDERTGDLIAAVWEDR
jgi:hypothetical protein